MELYKNIKRRRLELNLSQSELASKVGYKDKGSISRIENGLLDLTQSQIEDFAKALECSPAYLMGWSDNKEDKAVLNILDRLRDSIRSSIVLDLTEEEAEIIEKIRKLDKRGKKHVIDIIESELQYLRLSKYAEALGGLKDEST